MVNLSRRSALVGVLATAGGAAAVAAAVTRLDVLPPADEGPDEATRAHEARLLDHLHVPALG
ncbi:twin-arginine translocation signal domain-containing protein [Jiangella mangrovi]|uniref:Uncharacterized protein n=1 Tax=Jiangella mangrovi TaxID=1524084 RepID=A0A7W9GX25_9ACTN|nr:twin-arginine translocation signal domain-containing protein [Jiangella mangrovi]MBB5791256.1 hypothetical protein [Jiangella mangrovi]